MDMTEVRRFDQAEVGTIKLSEAIRIGAAVRPQCSQAFFADGRSCAIGAAYEGLYGYTTTGYIDMDRMYRAFPCVPGNVWLGIVTRNDCGKQTRESIAGWLEGMGL